ncbi:hypothetical protein Poli38472_002639 [Pythium oligandrum]|uniref:PX domain-containing protein n=1 Tax=Pythium oligandrum TaxID=41045 RepID=A0A8K1CJS1_PYTOL|nr:hypothetical protein Poli38472_002639 [Pythium oligandrum]|eukprot:TMW63698.1 hypothetical protein Poli38472_002639 [Pythium oligandrum]
MTGIMLQRLNSVEMMRVLPEDAASHMHSPSFKAPPLCPKLMEPARLSKGADAMHRLENIRCIEISHVVERENHRYYVINIYMQHGQSRIPTNQNHEMVDHMTAQIQPDFQVEKRFSDFDKLYKQMWDAVHRPHGMYCNYCDSFMYNLLFTRAKPSMMTKVFCSPETRIKVLNKFLHNVMIQVRSKWHRCRTMCYGHEQVPCMIRDFLFEDHESPLSPRSSLLSC